ncbi:MAG: DUF4258 domain-containing protein [Nitrospirota bacterium]|nr:DUF4258 domain-containing protein [Nitrospirota bacterium]MDE3225041.1 DUF4258 domain-containing protein [Nitrospirota bacterium]MDE3242406.1 DUF4258 domain-containing protein [Nitrospirota bacterium]
MALISKIREKVRNGEFEFAIPHFFEEMANDDLVFSDIEQAVMTGRIRRRFASEPRGLRFEVVGRASDGRKVAIICRMKETGKLLFITTYLVG